MDKRHYYLAKKTVKKKSEFFKHLGSYFIMSGFFIVLNIITSPGVFWAIFPILGWGLGVMFHALSVWGLPFRGKYWEERAILREMERLEYLDSYSRSQRKALPAEKTDELDLNESIPMNDELRLEEFRELRKKWDESDLV